jgi:hypothetical protein
MLLNAIAATFNANSTIEVNITGLSPNLSMRPPTIGKEIAEHNAQRVKPNEIEPRSQPNSASSGLMNTPKEKTQIEPFTTISAMQDPAAIHHGDVRFFPVGSFKVLIVSGPEGDSSFFNAQLVIRGSRVEKRRALQKFGGVCLVVAA